MEAEQPSKGPARRWGFTWNNPTSRIDFSGWEDLRYAIYQSEVGENGTPHYQGYLEFSKPKRMLWIKKKLPQAHLYKCGGTREQCRQYCTPRKKGPEGTIDPTYREGPWEIGEWEAGGQGQRNDVVRLYECVKEGKSNKEILEEAPATYMRYYKAVAHVRHVLAPKRDFKTKVYVIWGATGLGKTHWASEKAPGAYFKQRGDWWDEYDGTSDVIIDDFYGWLKYDTLLRICDKYACQVEIKGGHVNFAPKRIFITSNNWPNKWYDEEKCYFDAFARRVHKWIYFTDFKAYTQSNSWEGIKRLLA